MKLFPAYLCVVSLFALSCGGSEGLSAPEGGSPPSEGGETASEAGPSGALDTDANTDSEAEAVCSTSTAAEGEATPGTEEEVFPLDPDEDVSAAGEVTAAGHGCISDPWVIGKTRCGYHHSVDGCPWARTHKHYIYKCIGILWNPTWVGQKGINFGCKRR